MVTYRGRNSNVHLAEMNTMQYVNAIPLSGKKEKFEPSEVEATPWDPNHAIKTNIEKTRKWIDRLTVVVANGNELAQKVNSYMRKRPIQEVINQCIMRLSDLSK